MAPWHELGKLRHPGLGLCQFLGYQEHARTMFPAFDAFALPPPEGWPCPSWPWPQACRCCRRAGGPAYDRSGRNGICKPGDPSMRRDPLSQGQGGAKELEPRLTMPAAILARGWYQVEMVYRQLLEGKQAVPVLGKGEGE